MDLLTWLTLHWLQDTPKLKYLNWCDGVCWPEISHA